jgi:putative copper resistance protein D
MLVALYAGVRGLIYLGLLLLIGSQAARTLVARALTDDTGLGASIRIRVERLAARLILPLLALFLARGALQVLSLLDPGDPVTADVVRSVLGRGPWGAAWLLQIAAALVLVGVLRTHRLSVATSGVATSVVIGVIVFAQTGMGHAATNRWPGPLGRILDTAHLLGAGLWLGTLGAVAIFALPLLDGEGRLPALARLVRAFSLYARVGVSLVVVSGAVAAVVYTGSLPALLAATWGRLLLLKLAGMLGVLALGWYNWRVVTPALDGMHASARARLRVAVRVELTLALVLLAITTMLVVSPLPGEG